MCLENGMVVYNWANIIVQGKAGSKFTLKSRSYSCIITRCSSHQFVQKIRWWHRWTTRPSTVCFFGSNQTAMINREETMLNDLYHRDTTFRKRMEDYSIVYICMFTGKEKMKGQVSPQVFWQYLFCGSQECR